MDEGVRAGDRRWVHSKVGGGYLDDELLIKRAQEGDRAAFNALVRKYEERAYKYAFRLTRDPEEAADVVAEAFVRAYNALKNFRSKSSFTTWMYRILTNCFLDLKKKEKGKHNVSLDSALTTEDNEVFRQIEDPDASPHEAVETHERERRIERALSKLPEFQRAMVVMYHVENMTYEEMAAALDLPVGTVKSRLNRARLNLRELLQRHEELFRL
jgi:RNA polymerase sigma-70 factor, ECF subfamily